MAETRPPMFRMPTFFGPAPGPRRRSADGQGYDWSQSESYDISVSLVADREAVAQLLPEGLSVGERPILTIGFGFLTNLEWLAGRGYNLVAVTVSAVHRADGRDRKGDLLLVMWENLTEPILTGREELGFAKIFCDIPDPIVTGNCITASASWDGFTFLTLEASALDRSAPSSEHASPGDGALFHHRYIPATGHWGKAAVDELTMTPPATGGTLLESWAGSGKVTWNCPTWQDMPTQHHIVARLADLSIGTCIGATATRVRGANLDCYDQVSLDRGRLEVNE